MFRKVVAQEMFSELFGADGVHLSTYFEVPTQICHEEHPPEYITRTLLFFWQISPLILRIEKKAFAVTLHKLCNWTATLLTQQAFAERHNNVPRMLWCQGHSESPWTLKKTFCAKRLVEDMSAGWYRY